MIKHTLPSDIERTSMGIITEELAEKGYSFPEEQMAVVKRVIHTSADFDYAENLCFVNDPVARGIEALKNGAHITTDTTMAYSGISKIALRALGGEAHCYIADPEIARAAKENGTTRSVASMQYAAELFPEGIFAVGNAPTALYALIEQMKNGLRPALIIGVPVGFVNVVESKEAMRKICEETGVPAILAMGRKGGSNVAAAICNALIYTATDRIDPSNRGWN